MGFTKIDLYFSFFKGINITPYFDFTSVMDPPSTYQIVEIHDSNMIGVATKMGQGNDRAPPPPPQDVRIK